MAPVKQALLGALFAASSAAVDIIVSSSGGNETSGHQYGFLHEVSNLSEYVYGLAVRTRPLKAHNPLPIL